MARPNGAEMTEDEIAARVQHIIADALNKPRDVVVPSATSCRISRPTRCGIVEAIFAIEKAFDIKIPDDEAEKLRTVQDAIRYITTCLS